MDTREFEGSNFKDMMEKLEKILIVSQLDNLYPNFVSEGVSLKDIPYLSDKHLIDLGVTRIGDRIRLKRLCGSSLIGRSLCMERNTNTDQSYCETAVSVEERQPLENSWSERGSSTMVVPDYTIYSSSHPSGRSADPVGDRNIDLAHGAQVDIGDRDNIYRTGDRINVDEIENVTTELGAASAHTQSNSQYLDDRCLHRNNTEHRGSEINAKKIGTYTSRLG